ncbi:MAG TPA: hypothetical protein VEN28_15175 [Burkholderiaceae bacterium]|nr:hypothetical protein [Burkholderiaceae bacterium]
MVVLLRFMLACALGFFAAAVSAAEESVELQLPGFSHHFSPPKLQGRSWTDFHDGLGVQLTTRNPNLVFRYTGGFMRDSFNNQGLYAGGAVGVRLLEGNLEADLSLAPMLLYRTTRFDDARGSAPLKLIPVVMPLLSFEHRPSGIGGNLTVLPGGNFGKDLQFPGLIFLQFTYRLR